MSTILKRAAESLLTLLIVLCLFAPAASAKTSNKFNPNSLNDVLTSIGQAISYENKADLAEKCHIDYPPKGVNNAEANVRLLTYIKKNGIPKAESSPTIVVKADDSQPAPQPVPSADSRPVTNTVSTESEELQVDTRVESKVTPPLQQDIPASYSPVTGYFSDPALREEAREIVALSSVVRGARVNVPQQSEQPAQQSDVANTHSNSFWVIIGLFIGFIPGYLCWFVTENSKEDLIGLFKQHETANKQHFEEVENHVGMNGRTPRDPEMKIALGGPRKNNAKRQTAALSPCDEPQQLPLPNSDRWRHKNYTPRREPKTVAATASV